MKLEIQEQLLTPNEYSRPQRSLHQIRAVVMHWVANPMTTPKQNRDFFEQRKHGQNGYGSAHFIIGVDGQIIQVIPTDEMAYHVGSKEYTDYALEKFGDYPNNCTLGIELCHPDWSGQFTRDTFTSAARLAARLCREHDLDPAEDVTTHHRIVGWKDCPRWFVQNPEKFCAFKIMVHDRMEGDKIA
jgi:N-acetylmuramoyl-L-alanine amidase